jgi:hypothetical protein
MIAMAEVKAALPGAHPAHHHHSADAAHEHQPALAAKEA